MNPEDLKARCKQFSLRVIRLVRALPDDKVGRPIANQLIRSGTSVAANYRAACLAKSRADFASKVGTAVEEADESALWMELIMEDEILPRDKVQPLWQEATELTSIFCASIKTARRNGAD
ncbi:four helix bundle protein [Luteolibacter sp. SL250]|uniref:four helix bundle protein n=1 Tax=Luteolibacter sp. SL250 TaxID=2995170 RepID=UPI00226FF5B5|nr:four helix bundle protein [Luteolibacter sp. SL250]WAC21416.1 four helix bundle protein [Luteolibacter sp. SL250]